MKSRLIVGIAVACTAFGSSLAQSVNPPPPAGVDASKEIVTLSPFTVDAERDVGYVATSSLAGSRLNTPLKDTAAAISVLTAEFLADIGATDLSEALEWGTNAQIDRRDGVAINQSTNDNVSMRQVQNFRIRGVDATVTRNYFSWQLPADTYNIDRIEEQRGPNSVLFGIGSAGGVINTSTKQARLGRDIRSLTLQGGSFDSRRATLDLNQRAIDGTLAVRFNAVHNHQGSYREHVFSERNQGHLSVVYQLKPKTRLRGEYEYGEFNAVIPRTMNAFDMITRWMDAGGTMIAGAPVAANANLGLGRFGAAARVTYIGNTGQLINLANRNFTQTAPSNTISDESLSDRSVNSGGPGQHRGGTFNTASFFIEQQIGERTFVELAYNHQETDWVGYWLSLGNPEGAQLAADPHVLLPTGAPNPFAGDFLFEGFWGRFRRGQRADNVRMTASSELDFGKWGNYRLAGLAETDSSAYRDFTDRESWVGSPFNATPDNNANNVYRRGYVTRGDWSTYYAPGPYQTGLIRDLTDPVTGRTLSSTWVPNNASQDDDASYQTAFLGGLQARYFEGRIVAGVGLRYDRLKFTDRATRRNPTTSEWEIDYGNVEHHSYSGRTRTLGLAAHVNKYITLYANDSSNFSLPDTGIRLLPDSQPAPTPESTGRDYGIGVTLLGGKVNVRATRYEMDMKNGHDSRMNYLTTHHDAILEALVENGDLTTAQADARRVDMSGASFHRQAEGYEVSITANPLRGLRLQANYSYSDGYEDQIGPEAKAWLEEIYPFWRSVNQNLVTTSNNRTIARIISDTETNTTNQFALEGLALPGNRAHKVNVFGRYTFMEGALKGGYLGGGYRHQSKNVIGLGNDGNLQHGNSYWLADAVIGYRIERLGFIKELDLQLNVNNLFDWREPLVTRLRPTGALFRWAILEPRTWRVTAGFSF